MLVVSSFIISTEIKLDIEHCVNEFVPQPLYIQNDLSYNKEFFEDKVLQGATTIVLCEEHFNDVYI